MSLEDAYSTAVRYQQAGDVETATRYYDAILQAHPGQPDTTHNLGVLARRAGQLDRAVELIAQAISRLPDNANFCSSLGVALQDQRKIDEAATWWMRSIILDPGLAAPYSNLGFVLYEAGRMDEALPLLRQAVNLAPDFIDGLHNLMLADFWGTPVEHWAGVCRRFLAVKAFAVGEIYDLNVRLAISHWVNAEFSEMADALEICKALSTSLPGAMNSSLAPIRAYELFLTSLLKDAGRPRDHGRTISIIGDSHSLSYANSSVSLDGREYLVRSGLIMGCKAWHIASPEPNRYKWRLAGLLSTVARGSAVMISVGEIDCRRTEGILTALQKYGGSLEQAVAETVGGFVETTLSYALPNDLALSFIGVPAPQKEKADAELVAVIRMFNTRLKQDAEIRGCRFIDIYTLTAGPDGIASGTYHVDGVHLGPGALQAAIG
jgi:tetratricopeptide (TPR) repeat protein